MKKTPIEKIVEENEVTKEALTNFKTITSEQMKYAQDSQKMFDEENETFFYITLVFQNDKCAQEFMEKNKEYLGVKSTDQIFINGHDLSKRLGKPLKTPYVTKTVNIEKRREESLINQTGIYGK